MKLFLILFGLFILSTLAHAENIQLPTSVLGVDDIISEFRTQFSTKLVDLGKNYISTFNKDSVYFTNSDVVVCNNIKNTPGERLGGISYMYKAGSSDLYEKVQYFGCNQETALIEEVTTVGTNLAPQKFSDIIKGKRSFDLKDNETSKIYKIKNELSEEIFTVYIEKKDNAKYVNYFFLGQKVLSMFYDYGANATSVVINYYGYSASYVRKFASWSFDRGFTPFTNRVYAKKGELVQYLDKENTPISLSNFVNMFNSTIMNLTVAKLSDIIEYHTYFFPMTEATKSGSQNQRFLEELRKAQTRLLTNSELNLVKNLLQEFINAAELGQITDNRPKNSN